MLLKDSVVYGNVWAPGMPCRPGKLLASNNEVLPSIKLALEGDAEEDDV